MLETQDYRVITTIATHIAQPTWCNGNKVFLIDLKKFINAIDNIYPDACIPVYLNGEPLNDVNKTEESEESRGD